MNPDVPIDPRQELEARLTALLLGELPEQEAAALRQALAQDAELAALHRRLKLTIELVRETASDPIEQTAAQPAPLKLSEDRRQALLQQFKTVRPKEFARRRSSISLLEVAAVVAIVGVLAALLLPGLGRAKSRAQHFSFGFSSPLSVITETSEPQARLAADTALQRATASKSEPLLNEPQKQPAGGVYSANVVGYVNVTSPNATTILANPVPPAQQAGSSQLSRQGGEAGGRAKATDHSIVLPSASTVAALGSEFGEVTAAKKLNDGFGNEDLAAHGGVAAGDSLWKELKDGRKAGSPAEGDVARFYRVQPPAPPSASPAGPAQQSTDFSFQTAANEGAGPVSSVGAITGTVRGFYDDDAAAKQVLPGAGEKPALGRLLQSESVVAPDQSGLASSAGKPVTLSINPNVDLYAATPAPSETPPTAGLPVTNPGQLAWFDNDHLKQGNLVVADGTVAGFNLSQLEGRSVSPNHNFYAAGDWKLEAGNANPAFDVNKADRAANGRGLEVGQEQLKATEPHTPLVDFGVTQAAGGPPRPLRLPTPTVAAPPEPKAEALKDFLRKQTESVREAQVTLDERRRKPWAPESVVNADVPNTLLSAENLRRVETLRLEGKAQLDRNQTLLENLNKLSPNELAQTLPTAAPDSRLSSLLEQKTMVARKLASANEARGLNPADLEALRQQRDSLDREINGRAKATVQELAAKVDSQRKSVALLEKDVDRAMSDDLAKASTSQPYFEAKHTLEQQQRLALSLDAKLAKEKTDLLIPKSTMVEFVERAVPGQSSGWEKFSSAFGGSVERTARVRASQDQADVAGLHESPANTYDPYYIQTDFELLRSEEVLGQVITNLNLNEAWAKKPGKKLRTEETLRLLRGKLDLNMVKDTGLINIGAKGETPQEAAQLANAVAEAYKDYRAQKREKLTAGGIAALNKAQEAQQQQVQQAQAELARLEGVQESEAQKKSVNAPKPSAAAPIPQPEIQTCDNAFSTFSLNVSDVSFKLAAASLEQGALPDPASIRTEEFINAFDYRDPEAPPGVPVAFAWERAAYPFAQNRDLLRFSLKTAAAGRQAGRPMNIVLLLDNSGSMERADRVSIRREALRVLAAQLQPQDKFSVITFARTAQLRLDGLAGNEAAKAAEGLAELTPEGGTNLGEAMDLAYQTALRHYLANGINRVVLLTDGAANLGEVEPDILKQKVETNRKQGIALDCFGIGWEGYNDDLLEVLSRNGDGRYGFINTPEEAGTEFAAQLAGALHVAAADVKVQVEFNPNRVTAYRQLGYAKHQLTKEQFRDNTVDAAELGAAEAGNALYVVEVNPRGEGPLATVRVRYKVPGTTDYREQEWPVPYSGNALALEQASPALRLATSASAFAEWLSASPYAAEVNPDRLLGYLNGVPEVYGADPRPKKLEWMVRQARSIAGK